MPALIRSASLTNFAEVARSAGLSPHVLLMEVGLPADALVDPELKVPAEAVRHLLELCAQRSGDPCFGLRMAQARRLSNLGPVGLLVREEPTLRRALDALVRYGHLHNAAMLLKVEEAGELIIIREEFMLGKDATARQATELGIAALFRLMKVFLGPEWRPRRVCFAHAAPPNRSVHLQEFGRSVEFGHDFNGIVCDARDLDRPNPSADPVIARYARQMLESSMVSEDQRFGNEVRQLVIMLLPAGHCAIELVAQHLGMDRRTVHRRLAKEGATFSGIVDTVRRELATRYVDEASRSMVEVSSLLGFSARNAFSNWYRKCFGISALERQRQLRSASAASRR